MMSVNRGRGFLVKVLCTDDGRATKERPTEIKIYVSKKDMPSHSNPTRSDFMSIGSTE
jgi:hypothetical protein